MSAKNGTLRLKMTNGMTERQQQILSSIIEEYAEVASPVGSNLLAKLFSVSSATIRAEMAELEHLGYIMQPHTSAGRVPTDKGYRYYVNHLNEEKEQSEHRGERALTARVQDSGLPERAIRNAVDTLVELTHNLGLATIGNQMISRFRSPYSDRSYIGVLGPTRQSYGRVMGLVQLASSALEKTYGSSQKYLR